MLWFLVTAFLLFGGILLLVIGLGNVDWAYQDPDMAVAVIFMIVIGLVMVAVALVRIHGSTKTEFDLGSSRSVVAATWEPLQKCRTHPAVEVHHGSLNPDIPGQIHDAPRREELRLQDLGVTLLDEGRVAVGNAVKRVRLADLKEQASPAVTRRRAFDLKLKLPFIAGFNDAADGLTLFPGHRGATPRLLYDAHGKDFERTIREVSDAHARGPFPDFAGQEKLGGTLPPRLKKNQVKGLSSGSNCQNERGPNDNGFHIQTLTPPRSPGGKA